MRSNRKTARAFSPIATALLLLAVVGSTPAPAEDWPEWRGAGRLGVWTEDGIADSFPKGGLIYTWRIAVEGGYAGPAVAGGRVYVTDFRPTDRTRGIERALALDEATGDVLWINEWETDYAGLEARYAVGPRATPTVDGERVYVLGAMGRLLAFEAATGKLLWSKDFVVDYDTDVPVWGMSGAPLVDGDRLIALVGGTGGQVMAFDKRTGGEVWSALASDGEPGYNSPVIYQAGGRRQLIVWHPKAVSSLDPRTGQLFWAEPFEIGLGLTVASPVVDDSRLLVSSFMNGSMLLELTSDKPAARRLWQGQSSSEIETDGLHALITTPVMTDGVIYGVCSYGQLRALDAASGERLWESLEAVGEKARWAAAFIVRHGERYFINNDRGELVLAELSRRGYREIDRTELIRPTSPASRRRQKGAVHWSHPAYANRHVVVRNDEEIVRAYLGRDKTAPKPGSGVESGAETPVRDVVDLPQEVP